MQPGEPRPSDAKTQEHYPSAPWRSTGQGEPPPAAPPPPWAGGPPTPAAPSSSPTPTGRAPSPPSTSRTVLGAIAFVVVLVGAGVIFAAMGPPAGKPNASTPTAVRPSPTVPTATARPTRAPTAPPTATEAPPATPTIAAADAALLALISEAVHSRADCRPIAPTADFATATSTIVCRFRSGTITGITMRLFEDTEIAQAAYDGWQDALRDRGEACEDDSFEGPWSLDDRGGRLLCYTADGSAYLFWTDAQFPIVGVAWREDGYLKGLYSWWVERYPLAI